MTRARSSDGTLTTSWAMTYCRISSSIARGSSIKRSALGWCAAVPSNTSRNAAQDLRQFARVRVEHPGRGHLPDLEKGVREAPVQSRAQVLQKPWDLGLQLSDCSNATVERGVIPQEIVDDIHAEQGV